MIVLATFVCLRFAVTLKCLCDDTVARRGTLAGQGATRLSRRRERREGEKYRERERKRKKREK